MRALSGERMLTAWERGRELREPWRALALLEVAMPSPRIAKQRLAEQRVSTQARAELAELPLAERNALLMELRVLTFGRRVEGFAVCSACGAELEFGLDAETLALPVTTRKASNAEARLMARAVNSADLAAAMEAANEEEARAVLLQRTLGVDVSGMDPARRAECEVEFARWNAEAETRCVLRCGACGAREISDFDIASFLWREVAQAARRLLAEVHRLALAYGWSERAVLRMSAARRNAYLGMLDQEMQSA
jgi:hypothetical protein